MRANRETGMVILGMMTGTSCDGLDAVCLEFRGGSFQHIARASRKYPKALRKKTLEFQLPGSRHDAGDWLRLHAELGDWYASSAQSIIRSLPRPVDVIANHGQTLAHFPPIGTLQHGDPARIAERTGITVVSQFRTGDIAAGGQGAPLVPRFHQLLAESTGASELGCSIHNLGGISNLTYLRPGSAPLAWDTGPANLWIDLVVQSKSNGKLMMDRGGRIARAGDPNEAAVKKLLQHPYFRAKPPKSTGRDDFTAQMLMKAIGHLSLEDAAATATVATARSIVQDYCNHILERRLPLAAIYFCGGGAKNPLLLECIWVEFLEHGWHVELRDSSELGVATQDMEAAAFAFLGKESLLGHSLGGSWTGSRRFGPPGQITPGKNWKTVLKKISALET